MAQSVLRRLSLLDQGIMVPRSGRLLNYWVYSYLSLIDVPSIFSETVVLVTRCLFLLANNPAEDKPTFSCIPYHVPTSYHKYITHLFVNALLVAFSKALSVCSFHGVLGRRWRQPLPRHCASCHGGRLEDHREIALADILPQHEAIR